jgi:hypothetical protein
MKKEIKKNAFPQIPDNDIFKDTSRNDSFLSSLVNLPQSLANGVNYLLHGKKEDAHQETERTIHPLEVKQHHILLVMLCILGMTMFGIFKDSIFPSKNIEVVKEKTLVVQPPRSSSSPLTWEVEIPTAVNVSDLPPKLITQMSALYPEVEPNSYRWFRTPKGWSAYYDDKKAKVKFSTEGYWLETEERNFPINQIPEYLLARIKMAYTDYTLISCELETLPSGKYYELTLKRNRPDKVNEEFNVYLSEKANNYANLYEGDGY